MTIIAYIIPLILLVLGIMYPSRRIITFFLAAYMFILMCLNTYTPDYEEYEKMYYNIFLFPDAEIGFQGLCLLGNFMGLSYQEFRILYAIVYSIIIYFAIIRMTPYPNFVLSIFLFWPFIGGVSGIRQAMANSIMLFAIPFLYKSNKINILKYVLLIIIASTIHRSSLFYLLFIFSRMTIGTKEIKYVYIVVIMGYLVISGSQLMNDLLSLTDNHKYDKWLNVNGDQVARLSFLDFIVRSLLVFLYFKLMFYIKKFIVKSYVLNMSDNERIKVCTNISAMLLLSLPGYMVSGEFQRVLYAVLPIFYVVIADLKYLCRGKKSLFRLQYLYVSYVLIVVTVGLYMYINHSNHDIMATFKDNLLFV